MLWYVMVTMALWVAGLSPLSQLLGYTLVSMSWSFYSEGQNTRHTVTLRTDGWIRSQGTHQKDRSEKHRKPSLRPEAVWEL